MALGRSPVQPRFENPREILGDRLREGSIYRLLADHGLTLFPNDYFADLYADSVRGQPTIPARVMASVMLLQAYEGLSDAEATDRLGFDLRWQAACYRDARLVINEVLRQGDAPQRPYSDLLAEARDSAPLTARENGARARTPTAGSRRDWPKIHFNAER